jgi:hypothetical protein
MVYILYLTNFVSNFKLAYFIQASGLGSTKFELDNLSKIK